MQLSIVVISWNDAAHLGPCLTSIYRETRALSFEVIVTDNGSTDGTLELVRRSFPAVKLLENGRNLGFAGANNRAFEIARGDYVLVLNPDTIIRDRAIEKLVAYADEHPAAGAFGCRVLNPDGSFQRSAYPIMSVRTTLLAALCLRGLGRWSSALTADVYAGWQGETEREIGFQAGCCLLVRAELLRRLGGFDERLFFQGEDADLCFRIAKAGHAVLYYPGAEIVHIGGQKRGTYPLRVVLEVRRNRYRFFYKHYGLAGARRLRRILRLRAALRCVAFGALARLRGSPALREQAAMYRLLWRWHSGLDPARFIATGEEPDVGFPPLSPVPNMEAGDPRPLVRVNPDRALATTSPRDESAASAAL